MLLFPLILLASSFFQTTIFNLPLVSTLIVTRVFIKDDRNNFYYAFAAGLLISLLDLKLLGFHSLIYLIMIKVVQLTKLLPISFNPFTIGLLTYLLVLIFWVVESFIFNQVISRGQIVWLGLLILPIYYLVVFIETRLTEESKLIIKLKKTK